jgi:uncharacterized membrane protein YdjX (TVP38/TMEM64 family)
LLGGLIVLAVALVYALGLHRYLSWEFLRSHLDELQAWTDDNLPRAAGAFVAVYALATSLSLPVAGVLSITAGALFGLWLGVLLVNVAATIGATIAFLTSRYLFRDLVRRHFGARLEAIDRGVERDGAWYLLTLRLVPLFPFFVVNAAMGLTRIPLSTYCWASMLGMLPGSFVFVNVGAQLGKIAAPRDVLTLRVLGSLVLLGLLPLTMRWLLRRLRLLPRQEDGKADSE